MKPGYLIAASIQVFLAGMAVHTAGASNRIDSVVLLLKAENSSPVFFCAAFVPAIKDVPQDGRRRGVPSVPEHAQRHRLRLRAPRLSRGKVVLVERCDNISNDDLIQQAKSAKANGVLISVNASRAVRYASYNFADA
ncbi:hypothetical protein MTO96_038652 [Rhipicephalus appendiculatus]